MFMSFILEDLRNMAKIFNTTGLCVPEEHYMVNLENRLKEIKELIDDGKYFMMNRARQYGKTTSLTALSQYLQKDYYVVFMDFQLISHAKFEKENTFCLTFAKLFLQSLKRNELSDIENLQIAIEVLSETVKKKEKEFELFELFECLSDIYAQADKPMVLIIDEVDSATNNQVFLDFLAQLRAQYLRRFQQPALKSVILAGVHDVKNLKCKIRPDEAHKINSPWNIAADFNVEMSFSEDEIGRMLSEYEADFHTGMDIKQMSKLLYEYTSGYPFLVSRLCQLMDESISEKYGKEIAWTKQGFFVAVKIILEEKNVLFESLIGKLETYSELNLMIQTLLFTGKPMAYNVDNMIIDYAAMFGFVKNHKGTTMIANRLFETRLYNLYLSTEEMKGKDIYTASLRDKNQFIVGGHLDMRRILERFVLHFHELYGNNTERFLEEEGRKYFLLYLRPIINGVGNYYIEARTRDLRRTDIIVDYHGEQYIIEMKIWHGDEYNYRGEEQLIGYLDDYHQNIGYMVSFNFNKNKKIGVHEIVIGDKRLIEAVV